MRVIILAFVVVVTAIFIYTVTVSTAITPARLHLPRAHYDAMRDRVDGILADSYPRLPDAMREMSEYAVEGGRRVRAVIVLAVAGDSAFAPSAVTAVEYVHAASLIVDDMMDRDTMRRGRATVAARWGADAAQMVSVQLVAAAFLELYRTALIATAPETGTALMGVMAETMQNLSTGQLQELKGADVDEVMRQKTGSLFEMAFLSGWLARGGAAEAIPDVRAVAQQFGALFQIVDDIDDIASDLARGVTTNYAAVHGVAAARVRCHELAAEVQTGCSRLEIDRAVIDDLTAALLEQVGD